MVETVMAAAAAVGSCSASTCPTSVRCGDGGGNGTAMQPSSSRRCPRFLVGGKVQVHPSAATSSANQQEKNFTGRNERQRAAARFGVASDVARCYSTTPCRLCRSSPPCTTRKTSSFYFVTRATTRGALRFAKSGSRCGMASTSSSSLSSSSACAIALGIPTLQAEDGCVSRHVSDGGATLWRCSSSSSSPARSLTKREHLAVWLPALLAEDGRVSRHVSDGGGMLWRCSSSSSSPARSLTERDHMLSVSRESAAARRRWSRVSLIGRKKERMRQWTYRFATRHHHRRRFARIMAMAATGSAPVLSGKEEETMTPPYNVLITGSTKGVGYALAKEFLQAGDNVIICSRSGDRVEQVCKELKEQFGDKRVWGTTCNVADAKDVEKLALFANEKLGYVDLWINNAGTNGYEAKALIDMSDEVLTEVVATNMLGVIICCREAIRLMRNQKRGGHIFNMDGAGVDGNATPRYSAYGATKRSLAQFTKTLQAELKTLGIKNVIVHNLSPGMVQTDLLMSGVNTPSAKFFVNVLAEPAATVADYLVPRLRKVPSTAGGQSTYIRFLTKPRAYIQIILRLLFKLRKDRYVKEDS